MILCQEMKHTTNITMIETLSNSVVHVYTMYVVCCAGVDAWRDVGVPGCILLIDCARC